MRLLFMITNLAGGGAEKVLTDIVNNLDPARYDITVCILENKGIYRERLAPHIKLKTVIKKPNRIKMALLWRLIRWLPPRWMYRLCVRGEYDVEVAFMEGLATKLLSGSTCRRRIAWLHTDLTKNYYVGPYFRSVREHRACYSRFHRIVCVSELSRRALAEKLGVTEGVQVIPNLIDSRQILTGAEEAAELPQKDVPVVCSVGRLIQVKGYKRLLQVHQRLLSEGIRHKLWLVGEGEQRTELEQLIRENALEDSVVLWGFRENPYPIMKGADVFVSSSYAEGFGIVVAEAMLLGKALVCTHCAGVDEILGQGAYGLLTQNSEEGLYQALREVLSDPAALQRLTERAREGARQFSVDNVLKQIEGVLR